ncbi:uncharacterized protein J3D65DRAFT_219724 [Phyllosticta citribraziliensis]|uniref:ZW10 C-terminal helical domain-containing protein n=1 Tax=Phyllosticta citribraziliensis TaxID=989973 RepID=A0ABR1M4L8_9PEZI
MPPVLTPQKLGGAVLQSVVEHGYYPDTELVSAQLPADAIPGLLEGIEKAQNEVKADIRTLSRGAAPDVDGWIAQAKQLQADIERSRATAHDIVQQAEAGRTLQANVQDATSKVALLRSELVYNETLEATLVRIKQASDLLDKAEDAAAEYQTLNALDDVKEAEDYIVHMGSNKDTKVVGVLQKRIKQLRAGMAENAMDSWYLLLSVDISKNTAILKQQVDRTYPVQLSTVVEALARLGSLENAIAKLYKSLDQAIIAPRFAPTHATDNPGFKTENDTITVERGAAPAGVLATLEDARNLCQYLYGQLPESVSEPLAEKFVPGMIARLTSDWLDPSIPISLDGLNSFQEILSSVSRFANFVDELGWMGKSELMTWVEKAPRNWLARRKEDALASVRVLCSSGINQKKEVERVETQLVSRGDAIIAGEEAEDDWDAWDNDEEKTVDHSEKQQETEELPPEEDIDADASAWGLDDDAESENAEAKSEESKGDPEEEDADAWGWGDDDANAEAEAPESKSPGKSATKESTQKKPPTNQPSERELTLRETYSVTAIPDAIMEMVLQIVSDAQALAQPRFSSSPIAPAGLGLYSIPTLVLAMYRATAPVYYANDPAGNMLAYNDSTRLVDELRNFLARQREVDASSDVPNSARPSTRLRLDTDLRSLESFSKRAYGKEMESQRTILRDLLDSAQGFSNCTVAPFAGECENSVSMTVDRIRDVAKQWRGILSHSVLLQSLGSLLATVLHKMIVDIEDKEDISEEESKCLRSFCERVSSLNDLFSQEGGDEKRDMTGVYTPNWLKFQYLSEILESNLADIKYLWTEGELRLEFEAGEVVDLIEALFADSDYRRRAISEIKRMSM